MSSSGSGVSGLKSGVWEHFTRDPVGQIATCKLCKTKLKCTGGSTKSLHSHLKSKHGVNALKRSGDGDDDKNDDEALDDKNKKTSTPSGKATASSSLSKFFVSPNDNTLDESTAYK
jgi:ubiquitin